MVIFCLLVSELRVCQNTSNFEMKRLGLMSSENAQYGCTVFSLDMAVLSANSVAFDKAYELYDVGLQNNSQVYYKHSQTG